MNFVCLIRLNLLGMLLIIIVLDLGLIPHLLVVIFRYHLLTHLLTYFSFVYTWMVCCLHCRILMFDVILGMYLPVLLPMLMISC